MPLETQIVITCDQCIKKGNCNPSQLITTFSPYVTLHKRMAIKKAREHGWICNTRAARKGIKGQEFICPKCKKELSGEYDER